MIRGSSSFSMLWPVALTVKLWLRMHAILLLRSSMSFYTHGNHIFLPDSDHTVANNDWVKKKKHAGKQYGYWPNGSSDLSSATRTSPAAKRGRSLTSTSSASSSASVGKSIF